MLHLRTLALSDLRGVCAERQFRSLNRVAAWSEAIGPAVCVLPVGDLRIVINTYSSALSVKKTR